MYNNERVIIDTRKYDIDEMLFRYKQGKIIFYEKKCATWKRREKVVQDIIKSFIERYSISAGVCIRTSDG